MTETEHTKHMDDLRANPMTAPLVCPDCNGLYDDCRICGGHGVTCPYCRGARFVKADTQDSDRYRRRELKPCPYCCPQGAYDRTAESAAIRERFRAWREAA